MAKNLNFYLDDSGSPCARGPLSEKVLMNFLESDVRDNDHVCHDLMEDLQAVESDAAETRDYVGDQHTVTFTRDSVSIQVTQSGTATDANSGSASAPGQIKSADDRESADAVQIYETGLKHFREIIEDWEAFILEETDL